MNEKGDYSNYIRSEEIERMSNGYVNYYLNQAGSGLSAFEGVRYQRGGGFFGRLLSGAILPALRFLGRKALGTGVGVGMDILGGENLKESVKRRTKNAAKDVATSALSRAQRFIQTGEGSKRQALDMMIMSNSPPIKVTNRRAGRTRGTVRRRRTAKKTIKRARIRTKASAKSRKKKVVRKKVGKSRTIGRKRVRKSLKFDFLS